MNNDLGGLLFTTQKRPHKVGDGKADTSNVDPFTDRYFKTAGLRIRGRSSSATRRSVLATCAAFQDYSEDISILKVFPLRDQMGLRFEMQVGNLFDRRVYCNRTRTGAHCRWGRWFTQSNTQVDAVRVQARFLARRRSDRRACEAPVTAPASRGGPS
jgi:hypothetical protein